MSAALFGTAGQGTVSMTGFAPGPAKVATRMSGFGMGPTHVIAGLDPAISIECRAACRIVIAGTRPAARPPPCERLDTRHRPRGPFGPSYGTERSRGARDAT